MRNDLIIVAVAGLVASLTALPHAALAQKIGFYSGMTADNQPISFYVTTDTHTGAHQISNFIVGFKDTCFPGAFTLLGGQGFGGAGPDFTGTKTSLTFSYSVAYVSATLSFSGENVVGMVFNAVPALVDPAVSGARPRKSAYCSTKRQSYNAIFTPNAPPMQASRAQAYIYTGTVQH